MTAQINETSDIISDISSSFDLSTAKISSQNNDNESDEESLDLNINRSVIPANAHINVDTSHDVVIGSVTHVHGPVTIYQNTHNNTQIDSDKDKTVINENNFNSQAKLVATDTLSGKPLSNFSEIPIALKNRTFLVALSMAASLLACATIVALGLHFTGTSSANTIQDATSEPPANDNSTTGTHQRIPRSRWGGRPPLYTRPLHQPTKYVIISHTAGHFCQTISACSSTVAQIQSQHVSELESPDIGYNFVIGGDENIYIGRDWDASNFHMEDSIGISFIGNYIYDRLTPGMVEATQQLLTDGVEKGKLDKKYRLIAHNQTWNTASPGPNIYNSIRFWPHYSSELVPITP